MSQQKTKMTYHFKHSDAIEFFYEIRAIYNSPYLEEPEIEIIDLIIEAINKDKINPEYLKYKIKLLSQEQKEYKQKLSNLIKSKFWL